MKEFSLHPRALRRDAIPIRTCTNDGLVADTHDGCQTGGEIIVATPVCKQDSKLTRNQTLAVRGSR